MSEKENNKRKLSIIFTILREDIVGYKDIDHILPFLYFLSKSDVIEIILAIPQKLIRVML
jgi:hypothetical protein